MDESFFGTYFSHISSVACDKAKEHVEKRKNIDPAVLQTGLVQFAFCEKSYYSLVFMEQRWFGRKDPLKSAYLSLRNELNSLTKIIENGSSEGKFDAKLCIDVAENLSLFCSCRIDCIELYESATRTAAFEELDTAISNLLDKLKSTQDCAPMKPITDSFVSEFETFKKLIRSSLLISEWNFFDSLIELHKIHRTLAVWQPLLSKEQHHTYSFRPGLLGFGERRSSSPVSAIYQWMARYFQELVSKFSFYFYGTLYKMGFTDDMKTFLSKSSYDYVSKIMNFCKKLDSCYVLLCAIGNENTSILVDVANKMTHARVLELPCNIPVSLQSNLDIFLYNKSEDITIEKIAYLYDKGLNYSFYALQTDPGMIFVIAILGKRSEKDSYITNFLNETAARLHSKRVFSTLKPGVK